MESAACAFAVFAGVGRRRCGGKPRHTRHRPEPGLEPGRGRRRKAARNAAPARAESYGVEFNDHYLRSNPDGSFTVTVFGDEDGLAELHAAGYDLGVTIEGPDTWRLASRSDSESSRRRTVRTWRRWTKALVCSHTRTRSSSSGRLLRELRRALPLGRGEGSARQCDADRLDLRRAGAFPLLEQGLERRSTPRRGR